jgi:hypothetical protein
MPATKHADVQLTVEQLEIVGQFNDLSFEYPDLSFDQVARKVLGVTPGKVILCYSFRA